MKFFALLLLLVSNSFASDWKVYYDCGFNNLVIDRAISREGGFDRVNYQLVIRNSTTVWNLAPYLNLRSLVNDKGELIAPLMAYPSEAGTEVYSAQVSGGRIEARITSPSTLAIRVLETRYYGRAQNDLARIDFSFCGYRN
jgi:hypothetical protein